MVQKATIQGNSYRKNTVEDVLLMNYLEEKGICSQDVPRNTQENKGKGCK